MVYKEHLIELWINGNKVELENQESLNMRFNNVITDPTKISSTQAEYSFEFEIPATPKNNVILDYANNLGKLNKFHQRFNAEVYADGTVIFAGTITINGFKDNKYQLNLVSVKVYSLDDIFGDATMDKIPWYVPFDGAPTINDINGQLETNVVFPFVSYGAFQKRPKYKDNIASDFTSKFDLDEFNDWYIESFPPSMNVMETLKKAFEYKGYNVGGNAFQDKFLTDIYASTNLADGQDPAYNLGNPKFGKVDLDVYWNNTVNGVPKVGYVQNLKYPYYQIDGYMDYRYSSEGTVVEADYNLSAVQLYDMLEEGNVTVNASTYMYQPNEHIIVIPADGFYKINLSVDASLAQSSDLTAAQYVREWNDDVGALSSAHEEKDITFSPDFRTTTPVEIHLVRNYDDNIELIKGKNNMKFIDGYPNHTTQADMGRSSNYSELLTCFPHEQVGLAFVWFWIPTKISDLTNIWTIEDGANVGFMYKNGELMMYDQVVSPAFICGFSSMGAKTLGGGTAAVMRDGYSWSKQSSTKNEIFYNETGYEKANTDWINYTFTDTKYNQNSYIDSPSQNFTQSSTNMTGNINCLVYLNKGDKLQLYAVHRDYNKIGGSSNNVQVAYGSTASAHLTIEAASPNSYIHLQKSNFGYYSPTEFDVDLRVSNFFNKETKISEWVQQVSDAFNLEIIQNGKNVAINTKKKPNLMTAVDIDDRCNYSEAELKAIEYPRSMAIKYKIDEDEWGFERSAVNAAGGDDAILNNDDWKKYADSGYTTIQLNDDSYVTSTSDKNLKFSYTWYDTFHWYGVNDQFQKTTDTAVELRLPVISKFTYMIDGYDYLESMKHDGKGLAQRFWFKPSNSGCYVWTRTYPPERVFLYLPTNLYTNYRDVYLNLSYKNTENSLLTQFFNINAYLASNYVLIDVYLSADEYNMIKNGALVHFDSDLYIPVEVSGYDPSGNNATTLKLMKKVA